jgi:hypothetical protein
MKAELIDSLKMALSWLEDIAQVKDNKAVGKHGEAMPISFWNGAIRGEYSARAREWDSFCPTWHTGQAVKALTMAYQTLGDQRYLDAAEFSAAFIVNNRLTSGDNFGLLAAYEDHVDKISTSATFESIDGLFLLYEVTQKCVYRDCALDALTWMANNAWSSELKLFYDLYDPNTKKFLFNVLASQNRPLLDDGVLLTGWKLSGNELFKSIAVELAESLLVNEEPAGNWIKYMPCMKERGFIHPRHAYWWGMPLLDVYEATGDERFRGCFLRSVDWYKRAMRQDGGIFRATFTDFNTESFGHATSGSACACICFMKYYEHTKDSSILEYVERGLRFCMSMQFTSPDDPNLKGAILEKVLPPNGTDQLPYHIRDLGAIFFVQAGAQYLKIQDSL